MDPATTPDLNAATTGVITIQIPNSSTNGTLINRLACLDSSGRRVKRCLLNTEFALGVCVGGCGTTGTAYIAVTGITLCAFDPSGASPGSFVTIGAGGQCSNLTTSTASTSNVPIIGQVVGAALIGQGTTEIWIQSGAPVDFFTTPPSFSATSKETGRFTPNAATTVFAGFPSTVAVSATEGLVRQRIAQSTTVAAIYCDVSTAPDLGALAQSYTFNFRINNAATTCSCAISEAATTCNAACADAIATGDFIALQSVPANTPAATTAACSVSTLTTLQ